ncbi:DUF4014 family protein, partial [Escherichia coli]
MKHYLEKNYPRKSRTTEFLFFILFIVLMIPGFAPIFPDICYHLTHYKP